MRANWNEELVTWVAIGIVILGVILGAAVARGAEAPQPHWGTPPVAQDVTPGVPITVAGADVTVAKFRKGPSRRERKAMGLTVRNVGRIIGELQTAGEINENSTVAEVTLAVAAQLRIDNPTAFNPPPGMDWQEWLEIILAILERLVEIFLLFL